MQSCHSCYLLLLLLFLVTSCAVTPSVDQRKDIITTSITIKQEARQRRILYEQATQQLEGAHPDACFIYRQARAVETEGDLDIAIDLYHKAMQKVPDSGFLLTSLGMAYLRKEDIVPARRYLLKAVAFDPDYYKPRLGLGYIYLQKRQLQKAVTQLEASLQQLPTIQGTFLLGEVEEARGNVSRARELYLTVVFTDKKSKLGETAAIRLRRLPNE